MGRGAPPVEHEFQLIALDRADGSVAWTRTLRTAKPHDGSHPDGSFATPTPVSDGNRLVASFGSAGIFVTDMEGESLWDVDLGDMSIRNAFGEGSSPVLFEEILVINWDHDGDSFIVAFDVTNGDEFWRRKRDSGTTWTTPLVVEVNGMTQVIVGGERTVAYDLFTGEELWSYGADPAAANDGEGERGVRGRGQGRAGGGGNGVMASPTFAEGLAIVPTGGREGVIVVSPADMQGNVQDPEVCAWVEMRDVPGIPSPIASDGIVYIFRSGGQLSAFDVQTGDRIYGPERLQAVANAYASPVAAGDKLYFASRDGDVEVIRMGEEFESVQVNHFDDRFDASPAIADGELYLRGALHLYCIAAGE
jgi:outer membrane protein assembly factor BamB